MNLLKLSLRNITGSAFRSWVVLICAAIMAGFAVSATLVIGGAQKSMQLAQERLGADMIVVPDGSEKGMENAFLMGAPARMWMPQSNLEKVSRLDGVAEASPQLYLSTLRGATCCSLPEMFLIAYDAESDFTLKPWIETHLEDGLQLGDSIGGKYVYLPDGQDQIFLYGYGVDLVGKLSPTGTGLDKSMFITFETAHEIARLSPELAVEPLVIPPDSISSIMVRIAPGSDPGKVAVQIEQTLEGVTVVESSNLFGSQRTYISALMRSVLILLLLTWVLTVSLVGLVFSIAINERHQEIGVMRALGSTSMNVLQSLLMEGAILAIMGGVVGISLFTMTIYLFRGLLIQSMGVPFLIPSAGSILLLTMGSLALALVSVLIGAFFPAMRISTLDPALAMRE